MGSSPSFPVAQPEYEAQYTTSSNHQEPSSPTTAEAYPPQYEAHTRLQVPPFGQRDFLERLPPMHGLAGIPKEQREPIIASITSAIAVAATAVPVENVELVTIGVAQIICEIARTIPRLPEPEVYITATYLVNIISRVANDMVVNEITSSLSVRETTRRFAASFISILSGVAHATETIPPASREIASDTLGKVYDHLEDTLKATPSAQKAEVADAITNAVTDVVDALVDVRPYSRHACASCFVRIANVYRCLVNNYFNE
ncbi:hypothetical protein F5Y04DRAFT_286533 [Hypomontagnella monticulosa]|nr:hypothetical protein F5Y04DRAFT_286533 [Hypomontagnella monticulosa]